MATPMQPSHFSLKNTIRPCILAIPAFVTSTSDTFHPRSGILLDANENSLGSGFSSHPLPKSHPSGHIDVDIDLNDKHYLGLGFTELIALHRYPSASQLHLKQLIAESKGVPDIKNIFLGVGASDIIDLVIRVTCTPRQDAIMITPPTFGLYKSRAGLNDVDVVECPLEISEGDFTLRGQKLEDQLAHNPRIKVVFLASPGNPTGSLIPLCDIKRILDFPGFKGILVVDEAYIEFSPSSEGPISALSLLSEYSNLLVIQTLSKGHGLAGLRLAMAFANPAVVEVLNKIQLPFSISTPTSALASVALSPVYRQLRARLTSQIIINRHTLIRALGQSDLVVLGVGKPLGGNHANFVVLPILKRHTGATGPRDNPRAKVVCEKLKEAHAISVRFIGDLLSCEGCLRITVGTENENELLVTGLGCVLKDY